VFECVLYVFPCLACTVVSSALLNGLQCDLQAAPAPTLHHIPLAQMRVHKRDDDDVLTRDATVSFFRQSAWTRLICSRTTREWIMAHVRRSPSKSMLTA
jgi:hypothetical protein